MLEIKLDKQPEKFLRLCDKSLFDKITEKLRELKENPVPHNAKRVIGYEGLTFRLRFGKYRILYRVNYNDKVVIIVKIDHRERVY